MITKSGKNWITANLPFALMDATGYGVIQVKAINGNIRYISRAFYTHTSGVPFSTSSYGSGIKLGSGTTPPTADDYCIENMITSGINVTINSRTKYVDQSNHACIDINMTVTNTGSDPLTISEAAFYNFAVSYPSYNSTSATSTGANTAVMIDRTLLDSPITIPAGESATITYTIKAGDLIDIS